MYPGLNLPSQCPRAAGLTNKGARAMNVKQVIRLRDAMDGWDEGGSVLPERPLRRPAVVALAWRKENPWRNLREEAEHYEFVDPATRVGEEYCYANVVCHRAPT